MSLDTKHPLYIEYQDDTEQMRDTYRGERFVKEKGFKYLPPTSGMREDGIEDATKPGWMAYDAYRKRSRCPDVVSDAIEALLGVMHRKPAIIQVPKSMEPLLLRATTRGESMQMLLQRLNEEQLVSGRAGLLADVIDKGARAGQTYIVLYKREAIINWDEAEHDDETEINSLNLVVLDETSDKRTANFQWEKVIRHRVLVLGEVEKNEPSGDAAAEGGDAEGAAPAGATYSVGVFERQLNFSQDALIQPAIKGKTLDELPFVLVNPKDCAAQPDGPPLIGLSNLALAIYRGEADYRQSLFMQGQDTLVVIGSVQSANPDPDQPLRTGAGARLTLTQGSDAKYIGVDSTGLGEQREALENDYSKAAQKSGQLLDSVSRERESGEALRVRVAARTTTLKTVALSGAFGIEMLLKKIAKWMGEDPDEVVVTPNLDFVDDQIDGKTLVDLMSAKTMGLPLSRESIHKVMQDRGLTEKTYEEELDLIAEEELLEGQTDPNPPVGDDVPPDPDNPDAPPKKEDKPPADEK